MTAVSWAASWAGTHIAVSKRPEEGNNVVLLLIRKAEIAAMRIQVLWISGAGQHETFSAGSPAAHFGSASLVL